MSFRNVTIKIPGRECDQGCEWRHTPEAWAEIWEKSVSWVLPSEEGWLSLARRGFAAGAHMVGADGKVSIERWYHSPYVEKPFNSKVIKSLVPELRSHKCFCILGFLWYVLCICVMNILCTFHISVYLAMLHYECHGYVTKQRLMVRLQFWRSVEGGTFSSWLLPCPHWHEEELQFYLVNKIGH